ncbi:hypothetical protein VP01_2470g2 [Puccinia sorghi]|uniref:Uncharacterized protein n=1 Tax=Puccinia sorghi TaxID=27349 RepID=A0A0L6V7U4_9BASI|nr:hypothetical protein VP01_2470g2 [Puccinia sorghi]
MAHTQPPHKTRIDCSKTKTKKKKKRKVNKNEEQARLEIQERRNIERIPKKTRNFSQQAQRKKETSTRRKKESKRNKQDKGARIVKRGQYKVNLPYRLTPDEKKEECRVTLNDVQQGRDWKDKPLERRQVCAERCDFNNHPIIYLQRQKRSGVLQEICFQVTTAKRVRGVFIIRVGEIQLTSDSSYPQQNPRLPNFTEKNSQYTNRQNMVQRIENYLKGSFFFEDVFGVHIVGFTTLISSKKKIGNTDSSHYFFSSKKRGGGSYKTMIQLLHECCTLYDHRIKSFKHHALMGGIHIDSSVQSTKTFLLAFFLLTKKYKKNIKSPKQFLQCPQGLR